MARRRPICGIVVRETPRRTAGGESAGLDQQGGGGDGPEMEVYHTAPDLLTIIVCWKTHSASS
jgi:hypothetical protein